MYDLKCLHRDIKPVNILLTLDRNVKITNFGFSKIIDLASMHSQKSAMYYQSPEILHGQSYSYPADIWSLGCILYEMTTFHPPFEDPYLQLVKSVESSSPDEIQGTYSTELKI
jgi:NIMA (never in mitosis gene a)-related kinase